MKNINVYLLSLGAFLTGSAELVISGILNRIAGDLHISLAAAGQLVAAYSLAFAIGTPIVVSVTARVGRKSMMIAALALFVAGCAVAAIGASYPVALAARAILGLGGGIYTVVAMSSIVKLVAPEKMGGAIGMIALGFGSAMALGVPIGVAVAGWLGWRAIFVGLGAISLLVLLALARMLPAIAGDAPVPFAKQFVVLRNPVIVSGFFLSFLQCVSNSVMLTYLAPYLQTILHISAAGVGVMTLLLGLFGIAGSRLGGYGVDRWGSAPLLLVSLIAGAAALALAAPLASWLPAGAGILVVWMFSVFISAPALNTYFIQKAPDSANFVLGLNTSVIHLGLAAGAGAGGVFAESLSTVRYHPLIAGLALALGIVSAFISVSLHVRRRAATA